MFFKHLFTIIRHRRVVGKYCRKMGIPWRGLVHDLSKFRWKEFSIYKYYNGKRSPHDEARDILGYSPSWLYHRSKNKHHWEYWIDSLEKMNAVKIPYKYVIEMFCDYVGAGKVYMKESWTSSAPLEYHLKTKERRVFHSETLRLLEYLFKKLEELDEDNFIKWYKNNKKQLKNDYKWRIDYNKLDEK